MSLWYPPPHGSEWYRLLTSAATPPACSRPHPTQADDGSVSGAGAGGGINLANADAERTLLRIKQKLGGVEAGGVRGRAAGTEGRVNKLHCSRSTLCGIAVTSLDPRRLFFNPVRFRHACCLCRTPFTRRRGRGSRRGGPGAAAAAGCAGPRQAVPHVCRLAGLVLAGPGGVHAMPLKLGKRIWVVCGVMSLLAW